MSMLLGLRILLVSSGTFEPFFCLPERSELRHDCREAVQLHLATDCRG